MIIAKIHWEDFPLTYNCSDTKDVETTFGIIPDEKGFIGVVVGYDGAPSQDTLAQVKKYHSTDMYCPNQSGNSVKPQDNRFDSFSVEIDKIKKGTLKVVPDND